MNEIERAVDHLKNFGYVRVDGVMPEKKCDELATLLDKIKDSRQAAGTAYEPGGQVVVYDPTIEFPEQFLPAIEIPTILSVVEALLGDDCVLSSFAGSRSGPDVPGRYGAHIDGSLAVRDVNDTTDIQLAICLDPFTETNGATRVWPLSHSTGTRIQKAPWKDDLPTPTKLTAPKGSVVMFLGQTWHQIGPNVDGTRRWGLLLHYTRWWIKPTRDFTACGPEVYSRLSKTQKRLFGFNSRPPGRVARVNTIMKVEDLPADYYEALKT